MNLLKKLWYKAYINMKLEDFGINNSVLSSSCMTELLLDALETKDLHTSMGLDKHRAEKNKYINYIDDALVRTFKWLGHPSDFDCEYDFDEGENKYVKNPYKKIFEKYNVQRNYYATHLPTDKCKRRHILSKDK